MGLFDRLKKAVSANETRLVPGVGRVPYPAYRGKEPYIFISYSHQDSEAVFSEIARMNELGYCVWYDEGITPGNEWTDEIANALEKCTAFVVFFSPRSAASDNVQNEIDFALNDKKPCMGVYLEETTLQGRTRLRFGMKQAIMKYNMSEEEYVYKLTEGLTNLGMKRKTGGIAPVPVNAPETNVTGDTMKAPDHGSEAVPRAEAPKVAAPPVTAESPIPPVQPVSRPVPVPTIPASAGTKPSAPLQSPVGSSAADGSRRPVSLKEIPPDVERASDWDFEWIGHTIIKKYDGSDSVIYLPSLALSLFTQAFRGLDSLTRVICDVSTGKIGIAAFSDCPNLTRVDLPNDNIEFAYPGPVSNCPKLTFYCHQDSATHRMLQKAWKGPIAFLAEPDTPEELAVLTAEREKHKAANSSGPSVSRPVPAKDIPEGLQQATLWDFELIVDMVKKYTGSDPIVYLPDRIKSIMSGAFEKQESLTRVICHENVSYFGISAFRDCPELARVDIPNDHVRFQYPGPAEKCPKLTFYCHQDSETHRILQKAWKGPIGFLDAD